ncbi:MAG TPA: hypothetical protein VGT00_03930 [Methylomirabilota bacterium]|nr:hypothetical protein [Methylomirabilota bacterium]
MRLAPVLGRGAGLLLMMVLAWQVLARGLDFNAASGALRFIHGIDLVIHEAGHTFAFFLPRFLYILAGSALQVILPAVCAVTFLRQGQPASFAVALFWTGESIIDVAIYMADAKKQALPLLGGEGVTHDWNYLLAQLHLLGATDLLGRLTWLLGLGLILTAMAILANETWRAWQRAASA